MNREFHAGNRERLYKMMKPNSLMALFSGEEIRKTNDEYYIFFADRSFYYLTGLDGKQTVLLAVKDSEGAVSERVYILPPDAHAERWNGRRIKPAEAEEKSGVKDVRFVAAFENDFHALATSGNYENIYLDLFRASPADLDRPAHKMLRKVQMEYPYLKVENAGGVDFTYKISVNASNYVDSINYYGKPLHLPNYLRFGVIFGDSEADLDREIAQFSAGEEMAPTLVDQLNNKLNTYSRVDDGVVVKAGQCRYVALIVYMPEEVGNEANYRKGAGAPIVELGITLYAQQYEGAGFVTAEP